MSKFISKLGLHKLCLMSFILLSSLFTSEYAFSVKYWQKGNMEINFNEKEGFISFYFIFYDYWGDNYKNDGWLDNLDFYYSENVNQFIYLMNVNTTKQEESDMTWLNMSIKKPGVQIQLLNSHYPASGKILPDDARVLKVNVKAKFSSYSYETVSIDTKKSYMHVKWKLQESCENIKSIQILGTWLASGISKKKINYVYNNSIDKSHSNTKKNILSVLKSEISDKVKVTGETDAINVTGVEPGEQIKVYTVSGVEVKSVVATDDVVNIKLPTNQMYVVKTGLARYKVAL